jgi:pimeloyl-ACP methyl ester carboxylesterase/DNA-binding CsgD family transcriptional regulator
VTHGSGIRFLPFAGGRVAYATSGSGPPLVATAWWVSHLELDWADPAFRGLWDSVGEGRTLVRYDRPGVGMSDRDGEVELTLDDEVELLGAVLDHLGLDEVDLVGGSSGGCAAIAYAARFPERVHRLVLYGAYADGSAITSPDVRDAILATIRSHWGLGSRLLAGLFLGDTSTAEQERLARYQRAAASPEVAARLLERVYRNDVRADVANVEAPTVIVHRRDDRAIPYALGRELAASIPGATLVPLDGSAHFPWARDAPAVARAVRSALSPGGAHGPAGAAPDAGGLAVGLLSVREREVLTLVAAGFSDQQIADQLVVSYHTVHRHVANIRHKLGRGSRTAAVAEAARLGLL